MKKDKTKDPLYSMMQVRKVHNMHERTVIQEHNAANLVGGKRHSGSGASIFCKSDASSDIFQVECKQTEKKSMAIQLEWLEKIQLEAIGKRKKPLLHLRFDAASVGTPKDWVCIPQWVFERMVLDES
jgi:hypothetical protein